MASIQLNMKALLFAISLLVPSAFAAKNSTASCNSGNDDPTPVNGTASAKLSNDLYLSLTFGDFRFNKPENSNNFNPWTYGYISAPDDTTTQACVYMFEAAEAKEGDSNNGCSGVLSDSCIKFLQQELQIATPVGGSVDEQTALCPTNPSITSDEFVKACGTSAKGWNSTVISTSRAVDLSNSTCSSSPGTFSLVIPADYHTSQLFGFGANDYNTNVSDYTYYDRSMKRAVPFVVSVSKDGNGETPQVFCLSPDEVVGGARKPADDVDVGEGMGQGGGSGSGSGGNGGSGENGGGKSAGVSVDWRAKGLMAMGMAGVVGSSLVFA